MKKNNKTNGVHGVKRISSRTVFGIIIALVLVVVAGLAVSTIRLIRELNAPVEMKTPYNEYYQAKDFPGKTAMKIVAESAPNGVDAGEWKPSGDGKNDLTVNVLPKSCTQIAPSKSRLAYKTSSGDGMHTTVMVYGAGQARAQYDAYVNQLKQCSTGFDQKDNITTADGVALLTRGDMIVSVLSDRREQLESARDSYAAIMEDALSATSCVAKDETAEDSKRSFYYDRDAYTGLIRKETVKVDDSILATSAPDALVSNDMNINAAFVDPQTKAGVSNVPPEGPLPAKMESKLPTAPAIPSVQAMPKPPQNSTVVSYQVVDASGPGCGWQWSGQKSPKYDENTIASNKETTIKNARISLTNAIKDYNRQAISWSKSTAMTMSFQSKWDPYVKRTNDILTSWRNLDSARSELNPRWLEYVDDANTWLHWDDDVAKAKSDYESKLKSCTDNADEDYRKKMDEYNKQLDAWKKSQQNSDTEDDSDSVGSNGNDSKTDTNTGKENGDDGTDSVKQPQPPQKPSSADVQASCQASVQKPELLTQQKPARPVPPQIPDGVTIPSSWPADPLKDDGNQ